MTPSLLAAWWMQGLLIAALLAATAALLQRIAREAVPARVLWAGALVGTTLLTFVSPLRLRERATDGPVVVQGLPLTGADVATPTAFDPVALAMAAAVQVRRAFEAPTDLAAEAARAIPPVGARIALLLWGLVSATILALLFVSHRRLRRALRTAPPHEIDGVPVRLTTDIGPAVVGVRTPVVAVPRWLLTLPSDAQALVVRHERSHVAAGDPLLLMAGVALAALQPWNPVAWVIVSRLRLAIELDCDRRLLRAGTATRAYGDLLIALAAAASPIRRPVVLHPMFSPHTSHLSQRIIAMTERPVHLIAMRRVAVATLAAVAFVAACDSQLPTDVEVEAMDATLAERRVVGSPTPGAAPTRYLVDGQPSTPVAARSIPANEIASIEVVRGEVPELRITRRDPAAREGVSVIRRDTTAREVTPESAPVSVLAPAATRPFTGLLFVDGVLIERGDLKDIPPDRIESVEVVKGAAAITRWGPKGANGVILITTKPKE